MKAIIAVVVTIVMLVGIPTVSYVSNANYGNRAEVSIDKEYENLQNILSQYTLKIGEAAQVPAMMRNDLKDVLTSVMAARMGEGGSKATFQWFKEADINLDAGMYKKIQAMIEAGRNQFQNSQTRFLDIKGVYVADLGYVWKGFWLRTAGYPQLNVGFPRGATDDFTIVKSASAVETFSTGIDKGLKLVQ